ncbi:MAG: hypothetical protein ACKFI0_00545 [Candidatus Hodgkinia cicadicola]
MTNTQYFCFKLVNSVLDALALHARDISCAGGVDFVSEDKTRFNPRMCFDRITEAAAFDMLRLIDPTAKFVGEESSRLNVGARGNTWLVDAVDGLKLLLVGRRFGALC